MSNRERERESRGLDYNYDVIYIDPPYNTESAYSDGNNSANDKENISASKFIYRDKFSRNGWLNMMNERLKLAKKLLKDDGVIFVSIDDNEQAYLKVLMDEIFGEENFITNFLWQTNSSSMKSTNFVKNNFEYIVCYVKDLSKIKGFSKQQTTTIKFSNVDNDPKGNWFSSNATYKFNENNPKTFPIVLPNGNSIVRTWRFTEKEYLENKIPLYFNDNNVPRIKIYENEWITKKPYTNLLMNFNLQSKWITDEYKENMLNDIAIIDSFTIAKNKLNSILPDNEFSTPKPESLIKYLINLHPNKNARVLDFFAGSGTTGHAVLELNREDGGNRTFTLVTNNENNIGYDVTYERLYRINHGIGTNNETFKWTEKNDPYKQNLNVFDLEYSNISVDQNQTKTEYLVDTLRESLTKFEVKDISNDEFLNNLTNLYSLDKEKVDKPDGTN
ncbi:site-specific DNA-methyltransferase [Mycoplasma sp. CSL7491-lung]|uniref:site-specific DNA-methyltransferase n=1 Tax=Mycoplasma sp. CSL7491-lung TaxID=549718 RepID=UPI00280C1703|nr:site-specific DNA-methyltransferase [Mycoplasma sp. CSL7491-lung]